MTKAKAAAVTPPAEDLTEHGNVEWPDADASQADEHTENTDATPTEEDGDQESVSQEPVVEG